MEAPDRCSCYCACEAASGNERIQREAFWASPEGIRKTKEREAQEEIDRISRLPKEVSREQYEKTQSEYDSTFLEDIFNKIELSRSD